MFARAINVSQTPRELAFYDAKNFLDGKLPTDNYIDSIVRDIEEISPKLEIGKRYVFLDEQIIRVDRGINGVDFVAGGIYVDGKFRRHVFQNLPHIAIEKNKGSDFGALSDPEYWLGGKWRDPEVPS